MVFTNTVLGLTHLKLTKNISAVFLRWVFCRQRPYAAVMELADMTDSKSVASDGVWVRVPPAAPVGASLSTYPTPKNPCLPCVILQKHGGHVKCERTKRKITVFRL